MRKEMRHFGISLTLLIKGKKINYDCCPTQWCALMTQLLKNTCKVTFWEPKLVQKCQSAPLIAINCLGDFFRDKLMLRCPLGSQNTYQNTSSEAKMQGKVPSLAAK